MKVVVQFYDCIIDVPDDCVVPKGHRFRGITGIQNIARLHIPNATPMFARIRPATAEEIEDDLTESDRLRSAEPEKEKP